MQDSFSQVPTERTSRRDSRKWENDKKYGGRLRRQVGSDIYCSKVPKPGCPGKDAKKNFRARSWTEARQLHEARLVRTRSGEDPEPSKKTLEDVWETFKVRFEGKLLNGERATATLERYSVQYKKHVKPRFGGSRVQKIKHTHVEEWLTELRRSGLSSSTVTSLYRLLGLLLNQAVREGVIVETPLKRIDDPPKQRAKNRARVLSDKECTALIAATPEVYRALVALQCFTGLRISEVLGLVWENVDLTAGVLRVEKQLARRKKGEPAKRIPLKTARRRGGDRREVDLIPEAVALLKKYKAKAFAEGRAGSSDFVFCTSTGQPHYFRNVATRGLDKAANAAGLNREGIPKLKSHDLRHTAISRWIAAGLDVVEVARQSGDTKEVILNTYAGEFDRASRASEIRSKIAAGTSISLPS